MSQASRREQILRIIKQQSIGSLPQLQAALQEAGESVDVSTLSRDIAACRIAKAAGRYQPPDNLDTEVRVLPSRKTVFRQFILSCEAVGTMVVIHTIPGSANSVAIQIDQRRDDHDCAGTIAGDDTVFAQLRSEPAARRFVGWLEASMDPA